MIRTWSINWIVKERYEKSLIEVIEEFGKLVHPSKCEVPVMDLVVIIFFLIVIVVGWDTEMTSGGQVCLQLLAL
jgi:hypothetical protein